MTEPSKVKAVLSVLAAAALFLTVLWLVPHTPDSVYRLLQDGTGFLVVNLSHLFGLSATYDPVTLHFSVAGFYMRMLPECVALHYLAILTVAILLAPGQNWRRKLVGWFCCSAALVFFNLLRLIFLGVVGHSYPALFDPVHDYVWQVAFAILTVFLCISWLASPRTQQRSRYTVLLYSLLFSGVFAFAFNLVKIQYLTGVVWLADKVSLLANFSSDWHARWWAVTQKSFVMMRLDGERVLYLLHGKSYTVNLWPDMLGLTLFWGFCAGSLCWLWQNQQGCSVAKVSWGVGVGTLLLVLVHVMTVVTLGWLLPVDPKMALGANFLWLVRGTSMLLPIACWWLFWRLLQRVPAEVAIAEG